MPAFYFYFKSFCNYVFLIHKKCNNAPRTYKKTWKTKQEVKKELEESLICENHENKDIKDKAETVENCREATVIIWVFEELICTIKKIAWLVYNQGKIFERFKEGEVHDTGREIWSQQIENHLARLA